VRILAGDDTVVQRKTERRRLTVSNLTADTDYSAQVRAIRGQRKSKWSKAKEFTTATTTSDLYEQYSAVAGSYSGGWQNITYGTTGDATTVVEIDEDGRAAFTLDLGGLVFGLLDPDAKSYESTYDESGVVFTAEDDDLFGDLTITILANNNDTAQINWESTNIPVAGISTLTADGTLYSDSLDMNYEITFSDDSTATGIFTLTKTE
jgi:hypothetical protein